MKHAIVLAAMVGSGLLASVGCTPKPAAVYRVDQSTLPQAARALISPQATITEVHLAQYAKGGQDYVIDYELDGSHKQIKYGDYHQTQPSGVFEKFAWPETE